MTPTTVRTETPGMIISVDDGGPSKNVTSGSMATAATGAFTFSFGSFAQRAGTVRLTVTAGRDSEVEPSERAVQPVKATSANKNLRTRQRVVRNRSGAWLGSFGGPPPDLIIPSQPSSSRWIPGILPRST
eukprot:7148105-Prymnesium_polylepis.2